MGVLQILRCIWNQISSLFLCEIRVTRFFIRNQFIRNYIPPFLYLCLSTDDGSSRVETFSQSGIVLGLVFLLHWNSLCNGLILIPDYVE